MLNYLESVKISIDGRSDWYATTEIRWIESAYSVVTHISADSHGI